MGREGGGGRPRTHQPSPQHTSSETGEVVSESLEGPVKSDGGRYFSFGSRKQGWPVYCLLYLSKCTYFWACSFDPFVGFEANGKRGFPRKYPRH